MSETLIIDILRQAIYTVIFASMPMLVLALVVGLVISIIQTATSIQEQTLAFIPKILATLLGIVIFGSYIFTLVNDYARYLLGNLAKLTK